MEYIIMIASICCCSERDAAYQLIWRHVNCDTRNFIARDAPVPEFHDITISGIM